MYGIDLETQEKNWNGGSEPVIGATYDVFINDYKSESDFTVNYIGKILIIGTDSNGEESCFNLCFYTFKPVKNTKQKAIDEMFSIHRDDIHRDDINGWLDEYKESVKQYTSDLYDAGYTKSKVKPLSLTDFKLIYVKSINFEDFHANLIRDGYCIAEGE